MTPEPSHDEIKRTASEAERLLRELDAAAEPTAAPAQSPPIQPPFTQPQPPPTQPPPPSQAGTGQSDAYPSPIKPDSGDFSSWLLVMISVGCLLAPLLVLLLIHRATRPAGSDLATPQLGYSASCGSSQSQTGLWWPVLAEDGDSVLLSRIRSSYCGDAFFNARRQLQVASFGTEEEAQQFSTRLSAATGRSFRVGEGRVPVAP